MSPQRFRDLLRELIDDNPFAVRAVLRICEVRFCETVPTLAVTCEHRPILLVNLEFVSRECCSDDEVKAVICHELLHLVLRHTETQTPITRAQHLAFDAVINAIIHRGHGASWSSMMSRYYAEETDLRRLLRPMNEVEARVWEQHRNARGSERLPPWVYAWASLYEGRLVADDIAELAQSLSTPSRAGRIGIPSPFAGSTGLPEDIEHSLLGDHASLGEPLDPRLAKALDEALRSMNGSGIWRGPKNRGVGANPYEALFTAKPSAALARWRREALAVLRRHLMPDPKSRILEARSEDRPLPVLSVGDRRAFLQARWSPFLPEATWSLERRRRSGTAQVYLDVSGSMNAEMPELIALLQRLSGHIRRPFWAFSDEVAPATIKEGQLVTQTSGGTSMACVLEHLALTRPESAVVVTDGYIEDLPRALVQKVSATRLHVLLTRDGSPGQLARAGIPYTQLAALPQ